MVSRPPSRRYSALALYTYPDSLLSDAPPNANLEHLAALGNDNDKSYWKEHVEIYIDIEKGKKVSIISFQLFIHSFIYLSV